MKSRFSVLGSQIKLQEAQELHDIWENSEYPQQAYTVQLKFHGSSSSPANVVFGSCLSTCDCRFRQSQVWHRHFGYCPSRLSKNNHNLGFSKRPSMGVLMSCELFFDVFLVSHWPHLCSNSAHLALGIDGIVW